mmetsp:Transcript_8198/g.9427  ORF Transcript_8198/g.9427 Transcript_8198/m.9427 type:complete len:494 (+) Transcript_8198:124-1605(+)
MKAKQLLGVVTCGILITASVVVAFVQQQAATTSYRRAHSSSQIASSNNDLTSLLETTKYGIETGKQFVKTTGSKVTDAAITTPIPTPEDDKVLPLGSFIKETFIGHNTGFASPDSSSWDTAAANVGLLRDNLFGLIGNESPRSIAQYLKDLPENAKPWLAGVTVATLVIIGSSQKKKKPSEKVPIDIQATSNAIGSLTYELGSLQSRMKLLEANGLELDSKLKDATSKLTLKELDISKARLKAADISLNLGREIELLKQKLDINDAKVVSLDTDLVKARAECELLIKELDKAKHKKTEEVSSKVIREKKKVNDATVKQKQKYVRSERTATKKLKPKIEEKFQLAYTDEAEPSTEKKIKEKDPVKIVAKKKSPSPNKEAAKVQTEELPTAEAPLKRETSVKKKVATKVKKTSKDLQKASATNDTTPEIKMESDASKVPKETQEKIDFTTLSKSALSRKTVKELKEFLESKGLSITEDSGKPLKKNGLLEAVRSL